MALNRATYLAVFVALGIALMGCTASPATNAYADSNPYSTPTLAATPSPSAFSPSSVPALTRQNVTIDLVASDFSFDKKTIAAPAGAHITLNFQNNDAGVPHNVAVYDSTGATVFKGDTITGPASITYAFDAPDLPGNYKFSCDHHQSMTGDFVVS